MKKALKCNKNHENPISTDDYDGIKTIPKEFCHQFLSKTSASSISVGHRSAKVHLWCVGGLCEHRESHGVTRPSNESTNFQLHHAIINLICIEQFFLSLVGLSTFLQGKISSKYFLKKHRGLEIPYSESSYSTRFIKKSVKAFYVF